jgi:NAD(P)-dependent dehydrogenase (short-subunit alcohol dehydrogenase family)
MTEGPLTGRVAVVTGASRGIGAAAAKALAAAGAHVVLVARTVGGLEEVDDAIRSAGGSATLVPQDLRKLDEIDRLGPVLAERFRRCDVLVANAAMLGDLSPVAASDPDVWDRTMLVNVTANHRLIRTLDPLLRGSDAGRAVFVTSGVGHRVTPYWGAYAVSKAALEMMVRLYASEVANTPLRVNLLSPGPTRTTMRAAAFPGEDAGALKTPDAISGLFVDLCSPACARHGEIVRA